MVRQEALEVLRGVLAALIGMVKQLVWLAAAPKRHHERVHHQLRRHLGLHRPADDAAGEEVQDHSQIEPAFSGVDVGEVGNPFLIRCRGFELAIEYVARDRTLGTNALIGIDRARGAVVLWAIVSDTRNLLLLRAAAAEADEDFLRTLAYSLRRAIQLDYQIEEQEIQVELIGSERQRRISHMGPR